MSTVNCGRCGGYGVLTYTNELHYCNTCSGTGLIDLPSEYPMGTTENIEFIGLVTGRRYYDKLSNLSLQGATIQKYWNFMKAKHSDLDWWVVHEMYPWLSRVEKLALQNNYISITDIPGGPNRPEVTKMTYKPYKACANKIKDKLNSLPPAPDPGKSMYWTDLSEPGIGISTIDLPEEFLERVEEQIKKRSHQSAKPQKFTPPPNTYQTKAKEKQTMSSTTDKLKQGGLTVASAMKRGAAQGAVGAANRTVVQMLEKKMGEKYPEILRTAAGRKAIEALIPSLILMACAFDVQNRIPAKPHVENAAELALTDASAQAVGQLIEMLVEEAFPLLNTYAEAGMMIEEQTDFSDILHEAEEVRAKEYAYAKSED